MLSNHFDVISIFGYVLILILTPGSLLLLLLSLAGVLPANRRSHIKASGRFAIVIPAHNEAENISRTIENVQQEARRDGNAELIVVADNCTDQTAKIARNLGVQVLVRDDKQRKGKGFALNYAFSHLLKEDYRFFLVIDADSEVDPGFLAEMRREFSAQHMAVQARYTVLNPDTTFRTRLMELALCAFNVLRPRGRARLGWSAGILGNGFALRREVLENIPYSAGSIVEDLEYHLVLTWHDVKVQFADQATVRAEMPSDKGAARSQRTRWEGGRLRMLVQHAPGLCRDLLCGRTNAFEPLLDLLLLPLSYHVVLLLCLFMLPTSWAFVAASLGIGIVILHILAAIWVGKLPFSSLASLVFVPVYMVWKLLLLPTTILNSRKAAPWTRTTRELAQRTASGEKK